MVPAHSVLGPTTKPPRNRRKDKAMAMKKAMITVEVKSDCSRAGFACDFGISRWTVLDYIKHRVKVEVAAGKVSMLPMENFSQGSHPSPEEVLHMWLSATVVKHVPMPGDLLKRKAETPALCVVIHDIKLSGGWLWNFKERHYLAFKNVCRKWHD